MASACLPSFRRLDVSLSAPAALVERIRSSARPLAAKTFPALALALAAALLFRRVRERTAFDEGVYLDSLRSLKDGHVLGSEVFASQVPGFYSLLELDALLLPDSVTWLRIGFVTVMIGGLVGVYLLAWTFGGPPAGAFAVLLAALSPPLAVVGARVQADAPAVAITAMGLAAVVTGWSRPRSRWVVALSALGGFLIAAGISVKLSSATGLIAAVGFALLFRPSKKSITAACCGALVLTAVLLVRYGGVLPELWRSAVLLHRDAADLNGSQVARFGGTVGIRSNLHQIESTFKPLSDPAVWLALAGITGLLAVGRGNRRSWVLLAWPASVLVLLLWLRPLFEQHIALLAIAAAPAAGVGLTRLIELRWRHRGLVLGIVLVAVAGTVAHALHVSITPESRNVRQAVQLLRTETKPADFVVASDDPAAAFLAHRSVPPDLTDTSYVRLLTGSLTRSDIARDLLRYDVRAVLAGDRFLHGPQRIDLDRVFPRRIRIADSVLFVRHNAARR